MNYEELIARIKEITDGLEGGTLEVTEELETEIGELLARKAELDKGSENVAKRNKILENLKKGIESGKSIVTDDMEERTSFMQYVLKGTTDDKIKRAANPNVAQDLGIMIPHTVQQEIIKETEKIYGSLWNKVRKLNIPGGVEYPIGSFSATFNRITETTVSERQKGGTITGSVKFGYNLGEIRLAKTYLQNILSVPAFENELAKVIAEAFVKAMDLEILNGTGTDGQFEGITTKEGITTIEMTAADAADWKAWQKQVFAKIPLAMRNKPFEFVMAAETFTGNIMTLADDNNRPVYTETFNAVDGTRQSRFKGHEVTLVEPEVMPAFDTAEDGAVFAMMWVPKEAYAVNTNDEFSLVRYMDHETNQIVTKALVINDGKVLHKDHIILLKKKAGN